MPIAVHNGSRDSAPSGNGDVPKAAPSSTSRDVITHESARKLVRLLVGGPVDLARISDEIRKHHDLESLINRISSSLALAPEAPVSTIEEAVVALGTDRLRVLIELWSSMHNAVDRSPSPGLPEHSTSAPAQQSATPEARYLASFLHYLGCDSRELLHHRDYVSDVANIAAAETVTLTDVFMRDFFSLLPVIRPAAQRARGGRAEP